MMLPYLKPFKNARSNIESLAARGMKFSDYGHAERCISRIGYYRLSAYWYPFRDFCVLPGDGGEKKRCDHFKQGTTFEQALDFYLFDKELRLMVMDALERIEIAMRSAFVEVLGELGPHAHRDRRSYNNHFSTCADGSQKTLLERFLAGVDESFSFSKEEFAKHFRNNYSGKPPIWIAAGGWDWGNLAYTFLYLSERNMDDICRTIDRTLSRKALVSWMACLNEVRNACAHHSRLWNKVLTNSPSFQKAGQLTDFDHMRDDKGKLSEKHSKRLYGALVAIIFLLKKIHPKTEWHFRLSKMLQAKEFPHEISFSSAGFPEGWSTTSIWN